MKRAQNVLDLPAEAKDLTTLITTERLIKYGFLSQEVGSLCPFQEFYAGRPLKKKTISRKGKGVVKESESDSDDESSSEGAPGSSGGAPHCGKTSPYFYVSASLFMPALLPMHLIHPLIILCAFNIIFPSCLADMGKLPTGFGLRRGSSSKQGAPDAAKADVSASQPLQVEPLAQAKPAPTKRKNQEGPQQALRKTKSSKLDASQSLPYDRPVTKAGDYFSRLADAFVLPSQMEAWSSRTDEQAQEAMRRAAAELFFHTSFNPSDTSKIKARLEDLEKENNDLKKSLAEADTERVELRTFKNKASVDISLLKRDESSLRTELNATGRELTETSRKLVVAESELVDLKARHEFDLENAFADGFRDYVAGFLAVDPEYDWSKFGEKTRDWVADFRRDEAAVIAEKREAIEAEKATVLAEELERELADSPLHEDGARPNSSTVEDVINPLPFSRLSDLGAPCRGLVILIMFSFSCSEYSQGVGPSKPYNLCFDKLLHSGCALNVAVNSYATCMLSFVLLIFIPAFLHFC